MWDDWNWNQGWGTPTGPTSNGNESNGSDSGEKNLGDNSMITEGPQCAGSLWTVDPDEEEIEAQNIEK